MTPLVLSFLWKAVVTAGVIIAISRVAQSVGPWLAAILVGFPMSIGPGMVLLSLEHDREFISQGALYSLATTTPVLCFLLAYVHLSRVTHIWYCLLGAYAAWLVLALGLTYFALSLVPTLVVILIAFWLTDRLMPRLPLDRAPPASGRGWTFMIVRGVAAGLLVSTVVLFAHLLGPRLSGVLVGFPVVVASAAWMLASTGGERLAAATLSYADRGLASFVVFCLSVHLLAGPLSAFAATMSGLALSVAASAATVAITVLYGRRVQNA
ncbi:MAG: hypothetical protein K0U93_20325 [Gammaproteobacteria bacterium]|nr:hypothetical protein [Gammaproteobacteria bacterium]